MVAAVPPPDLPRPFCVIVRKGRSSHPQQGGKAAGKVICRIVQFGRDAAKVEVFFVFVAQHTVHRVDGLVGQGQRCPADDHIEQGRDHAVAGVFGHRFHSGSGHPLQCQILGVPPHDAADRPAGSRQVRLDQLPVNIGALLRQPLCGQCLPAPEHLDGQPQPRADAGSSQADQARQQKGAHRQAEGHNGPAQQFPLRRFGQTGPQALFQRRDGLAHVHHRVGQPGRVAEEAVQHKTAEYCVFDHRASSFVYCTVFSRCSTRCSAQSPASRT